MSIDINNFPDINNYKNVDEFLLNFKEYIYKYQRDSRNKLSKYELDIPRKERNKFIVNKKYLLNKLSSIEEECLIGTILGDGYLVKRADSKNSYFTVVHSEGQYDYIMYKYNILKNWCPKGIRHKEYLDKRDNKKYKQLYFSSIYHPVFNYYYNLFYPYGRKIVPTDLLKKINNLGFFIWFMDDGGFSVTKRLLNNGQEDYNFKSTLSTYCFTKEENFIISEFLKNKFNLSSSVYFDQGKRLNRKTKIYKSLNKYYINFNQDNSLKIQNIINSIGIKDNWIKNIVNKLV